MNRHLTDAEMREAMDGAASADALAHLAECACCAAERDRLHRTVATVAAQARHAAERSQVAWDRQARQILYRVREPRRATLRWRWAAVPALVGIAALAGVWLQHQHPAHRAAENDEALLTAVQQSIRADIPSALRPVALLLDGDEDQDASSGRNGRQGG